MKRLTAVVRGRVQGVFFREHSRREAQRLGLTGRVSNEWDGSVRVVAEGAEDRLEQLRHFLYRGSPSAMVESVDCHWSEASGEFDAFEVVW